jgi:hypothetical protein
MIQKFMNKNLKVEETDISEQFSFTNSFVLRIYDEVSIFSQTVDHPEFEDAKERRALQNLKKIVTRDEIKTLEIPVPYVNMAFHHLNDNLFIKFVDENDNHNLAKAFNYEADATNSNRTGMVFQATVISGPLFPRPVSLKMPYLTPVFEISTRFSGNPVKYADLPYKMPRKTEIEVLVPLLLTPVDTKKFEPECILIKQSTRNPDQFEVDKFIHNSKLVVNKRNGKLMVQCKVEVEIYSEKGGIHDNYNWITVVADQRNSNVHGGGREKEWQKRTEIGREDAKDWKFFEYNAKKLFENGMGLLKVNFSVALAGLIGYAFFTDF